MNRKRNSSGNGRGVSPVSRRSFLRWSALSGVSALAAAFVFRGRTSANGSSTFACQAASLPGAIASVMGKPRYANATWNLLAIDIDTGEVLNELNPDQMAFTGSVRKLFSVGLALTALGAEHRFTTFVYRNGTVDAQGTLQGDLVLVAPGDLTFGGRLNADGSIAFTDFDHNDANSLGTAILTPQDPLFALDRLAQQTLAAGVRTVAGDVIVDDRLFPSFRVPNGDLLITPIMLNENMVDVTLTPTDPGLPATLDWRPRTQAFEVQSTVSTSPVGGSEDVSLSGNGRVQCIGMSSCSGSIDGTLPVGFRAPLSGSPTLVQTFRIESPAAFARTAFIEALQRAGVKVSAPLIAENPSGKLPAPSSYSAGNQTGQFVSPPYSNYAKLILKVSLNLGANLSLMHFGLTRGQQTIGGALAAERQALTNEMGVNGDAFDFPTNGSGSPDSRATARAVVQMLREMSARDEATVYRDALPILGADGSLATTGVNLPARGHVFAKTGTTVEGRTLIAQNLAGYIDARSGRRLAFALFVNNAGTLEELSDIGEVFEDETTIANALYELY
jgi:PBP4 family serine-type D-alanyl-D-alanine carboxypeptidase